MSRLRCGISSTASYSRGPAHGHGPPASDTISELASVSSSARDHELHINNSHERPSGPLSYAACADLRFFHTQKHLQ